jgi:hypothetical protein
MKKSLKTINKKTRKNIKKVAKGDKKRRYRTIKGHYKDLFISSATSANVHKISNRIAKKLKHSKRSYTPSINKELITLQSLPRGKIEICNEEKAFNDEEPLQIFIKNDESYHHQPDSEGICISYYMKEAKDELLKNLKANKHINPEKIITPIQIESNCWFNTLFVTFFISDKARKFFHFLRELMITGIQKNKKEIPKEIRNTFALLNYAIDACLSGNEIAYQLDTNKIIKSLYDNIPEKYKSGLTYIDEAGNPLSNYITIINYLNNNSIQILIINEASSDWKNVVAKEIDKMVNLPHIIILEVFPEDATNFNKKPVSFKVNDASYEIDSASIIDTTREHFCATITCEGKEMAYDGASFHRLVPLQWKHKMNSDFSWGFEGTETEDGKPLKWNFTKCYQLLMYYRVK